MRIFTWNVAAWAPTVRNIELRHQSVSAFFSEELRADVVCLQEAKVNRDRLDRAVACVPGYESFWSISQARKGYSGVTTFVSLRYAATRAEVDCLPGATDDLNKEGRVVLTEHPGGIAVVNVYVPNAGGAPDPEHERVDRKCRFLEGLRQLADRLRAAGKEVVIVGDLNSALEPRDCHESHDFGRMYTRRELAAFGALTATYADAWRRLHPDDSGVYTVFDERTSARAFNRGVRIDYALVSPGLLGRVASCEVVATPPKWSDHVGLIVVLRDVPSHPHGAVPPPCALSSRKLFSSPLAALFAKAQAGGGGRVDGGGGGGGGSGRCSSGEGEKAVAAAGTEAEAAAAAAAAAAGASEAAAAAAAAAEAEAEAGARAGAAAGAAAGAVAAGGGGGVGIGDDSGGGSVDGSGGGGDRGGSGPGPPSKRAADGNQEEEEREAASRKRPRVAASSAEGGEAAEGRRGGGDGDAGARPAAEPAREPAGAGGGGDNGGSKARGKARGKTQQKKQRQKQQDPAPLSGGQRSITSFFGKRG